MNRMGHDSMRAALIYQHATRAADTTIAGAMADMIDEHANDEEDDGNGDAPGAPVPVGLQRTASPTAVACGVMTYGRADLLSAYLGIHSSMYGEYEDARVAWSRG